MLYSVNAGGLRMKTPISVLLVDDHAILRKGLRDLLEDDPEIRVVGEAANGLEAVQLAGILAPRVVVMDVAMPVMDGVAATREIVSRSPDTLVLMLSINTREKSVREALAAGARGFLAKSAANLDLGAAVKAVVNGEPVGVGADRR
jgi:DNA-binding NarL/FixJ family response regulator